MNELRIIGLEEGLRGVNATTTATKSALDAHIEQYRRSERNKKWAFGTFGTLVVGGLGLIASEVRRSVTADSRRECGEVARQEVRDARAEHSELRAADQRLADKQIELGRELQKVAMHRLAREARPK